MDKQKKLITVLFVLTIVFTIIGSTFAYWNWQSSAMIKRMSHLLLHQDFHVVLMGEAVLQVSKRC